MATPLRLLILEDNPSDAELMLHALRHAGYDPIADRVETERDYRDRLQSAPEIVLCDFSMPEFDALRALEVMQECQLDIPVIIVSGTIGEERAVQIMQKGATDYIIKDRLGRLGHAVSQALEQKRLREIKRRADQALRESEQLSREVQDARQRQDEASKKTQDTRVAVNEALLLSSVRQHELTERAETLNAQLRTVIAERKQVERELSEKARLLDLSNDAIIVHDFDDKISLWNKGAEKLYGWTCEEALGKRLRDLLQTEFSKPLEEIIAQLRREGQFSGEVVQVARDGRRVSLLCRKVLDRGTESILTTYTDISERKHFEDEREAHLANEQTLRKEAEAANRSKDLFLATLSHEVRTPLNAILGWATILRSGTCNAADLEEGMEVIERNCKAQAQLIEDVLDISRIVSGKMELHLRPCELIQIINVAIDAVRPAADAKGVRFETTLEPAASHASCDMNRIQQVVWNLLINAVKFSARGTVVRITLVREGSAAKIEVRDEGQGISLEFLPYVFDRFRQADSSTRRKLGGLGLGLSIVKHIVEVHGGTVHATSAGAGRGATFTVILPIRAIHVADGDKVDETPAPELAPVRLDGLRVLVVDDEPDARRLLVKVLGDAGAIVIAVTSVAEALLAVTTAKPHVLLSDIALPDQDGYDLIRQVRATGHSAKDLPAVALTAFAHKDDRLRVLLAGFQVHIPKPTDPHKLIAVIASLSGRTS